MSASLSASLAIAGSGLAAVNAELALVSHNIANASTPGYAAETIAQTSLTAAGQGQGVITGIATRSIDTQLQQDLLAQNGQVAALTTTQTALQPVDAAQGTVATGNDLSSLLASLAAGFTALASQPSSAVQQQAVVGDAASLASQINALGDSYVQTRQTAQDSLVADVGTLNTQLALVGSLSDQIVAERQAGRSTADLEGQRDAALTTISGLVGIKTLDQPNGDVIVSTDGGLQLPVHANGDARQQLQIAPATIGPDSARELGDVPAITLGGTDITTRLAGGSIGANVTLRDTTLPTWQAELDQFSQTLSTRFADQGLALFTNAAGSVPAGGGTPAQAGYVGYALAIQVNPAVQADAALVRDGTTAIAGSATGASAFTPNTDPTQTGFATLIARIASYTFGSQIQAGVAQPATPLTGLGPAGTLAAPYVGAATLSGAAASLIGAQSATIADTQGALSDAQAIQTTLGAKLSAGSAVDTDVELATMVKLQASYGANAKIFTAVQAMWSQLIAAVT